MVIQKLIIKRRDAIRDQTSQLAHFSSRESSRADWPGDTNVGEEAVTMEASRAMPYGKNVNMPCRLESRHCRKNQMFGHCDLRIATIAGAATYRMPSSTT